jgi:23S rRNA (uracil1939-C5)-methyltransferase
MSRKRSRLPTEPVRLTIDDWSHEGRGVARNAEGKTVFVDNAIPGESVDARIKHRQKNFDTAVAETVFDASPDRVEPRCEHFLVCGGCALQHVGEDRQIALKQSLLERQFLHFGGVAPECWLPPMTGSPWGYRRKARLAVKHVARKGGVLVGFRERYSHFVAEIERCHVLHPQVGMAIGALKELIQGMVARQHIPQIEVAVGDRGAALIFRHLIPLSKQDTETLMDFGQAHGFDIYLQPKGPETVHKVWPQGGEDRLFYELPDFSLEMAFHPTDFTQVNHDINRQMTRRAIELLDVQKDERVLDLFCGLGNFSLPLATRAAEVIGIEGSQAMVERGYENARRNNLSNLRFFAADLSLGLAQDLWGATPVDKVLIDPPRTGALEVCRDLLKLRPRKIVYVSCNPSTLARDAGILAEGGYKLSAAGVMDMFPHTSHVESMAVFDMR